MGQLIPFQLSAPKGKGRQSFLPDEQELVSQQQDVKSPELTLTSSGKDVWDTG